MDTKNYKVAVMSNISGAFRYYLKDFSGKTLNEIKNEHTKRVSIYLIVIIKNKKFSIDNIEIFDNAINFNIKISEDKIIHEKISKLLFTDGIIEMSKGLDNIPYESYINFNREFLKINPFNLNVSDKIKSISFSSTNYHYSHVRLKDNTLGYTIQEIMNITKHIDSIICKYINIK